MIRSLICSVIFSFFLYCSYSQSLTGVWEGTMSGGESIQVNIIKKKSDLCGYTRDYVIRNPSSYCKASFRGWFDSEEEVWVLVGNSFIENSGDHILMILRLWHEDGDPADVLRGTEEAKYRSRSLFNIGRGRSTLRIRRVSSVPPADMPDCFPTVKKPDSTSKGKEVTIKPDIQKPLPVIKTPEKKPVTKPAVKTPAKRPAPAVPKPPVVKKTLPTTRDSIKITKRDLNITRPDTAKKISRILPAPAPKNMPDLLKQMSARKNTEFSRIVVHEKSITLKLYDNGIVDNDTVSVFYNGKLIAGKRALSEKPIELHLDLDENAPGHEIVMFAENLGSIPPNTALIVVTVDGKRYELHSSASLTENAVLTFEYKPN